MTKLGESSCSSICADCLTSLAEGCGLEHVLNESLSFAMDTQKNPKVQSELFTWMANAIKEFGFKWVWWWIKYVYTIYKVTGTGKATTYAHERLLEATSALSPFEERLCSLPRGLKRNTGDNLFYTLIVLAIKFEIHTRIETNSVPLQFHLICIKFSLEIFWFLSKDLGASFKPITQSKSWKRKAYTWTEPL